MKHGKGGISISIHHVTNTHKKKTIVYTKNSLLCVWRGV